MSAPQTPDPAEPKAPNPPREPQRGGCPPALLGLIGVLLVLPGICSFLFMLTVRATPDLWSLWLATYIVAAAGIALIAYVSRNRQR